MASGAGGGSVGGEAGEHLQPGLPQPLHRGGVEIPAVHGEPQQGTGRRVLNVRADLQGMGEDQVGAGGSHAERPFADLPRRVRGDGRPAEIVESDLRGRQFGQPGPGVGVEMAQQPVAEPVARNGADLLLHGLQQLPGRHVPGRRGCQVDAGNVEADRMDAGEPAHGAQQILAVGRVAAVSLQVHQHPGVTAAPLRHRARQARQQDLLDPAVEGSRGLTHQVPRRRPGQCPGP